jgi:hypothetical protein
MAPWLYVPISLAPEALARLSTPGRGMRKELPHPAENTTACGLSRFISSLVQEPTPP